MASLWAKDAAWLPVAETGIGRLSMDRPAPYLSLGEHVCVTETT